MSKEQNNYVHVGETLACGHCRPDEIFELMEKYGLECDCKCHQETKLPEDCCLDSCPFGKCHTGGHGTISRMCSSLCDCKCHSPQKEELKEWEEKLKEIFNKSKTDRGIIRTLSNFISQVESKAYNKGREYTLKDLKEQSQKHIKQEVISLCLEKIEGMKKEVNFDLPTTDYCYSDHDIRRSYNQALQDLSDKLKGI